MNQGGVHRPVFEGVAISQNNENTMFFVTDFRYLQSFFAVRGHQLSPRNVEDVTLILSVDLLVILFVDTNDSKTAPSNTSDAIY